MDKVITTKMRTATISRSVLTDLAVLAVVYYLPTISHLLAFPLYLLDPMRIVIFASILFSGNKANSYFMALTIPIFSYFVGGHPVFVKSLLIGIELLANVALFWYFYEKKWNVFVSTLLSIVIAKCLYYLAKIAVVNMGWLQSDIISTPLLIQAGVALAISLIITLLFRWTSR